VDAWELQIETVSVYRGYKAAFTPKVFQAVAVVVEYRGYQGFTEAAVTVMLQESVEKMQRFL
jgi:hypothetical protein